MKNHDSSKSSVVGVHCHRISDESHFNFSQTSMAVSSAIVCRTSCITHECSPSVGLSQGADQTKSTNCTGVKESFKTSFEKKYPCGVHDVVLALACTSFDSAATTFVNVKSKPFYYNDIRSPDRIESSKSGNCLGFSPKSSLGNTINGKSYEMQHALSSSPQVKDEPLDSNYIYNFEKKYVGRSFIDSRSVKSLIQNHVQSVEDLVDHFTLKERIKLLVSGDVLKTNTSNDFQNLSKTLPSFIQRKPVFSEAVKPIGNKRQKTQKKTATDSVETALEDVVPGFLQSHSEFAQERDRNHQCLQESSCGKIVGPSDSFDIHRSQLQSCVDSNQQASCRVSVHIIHSTLEHSVMPSIRAAVKAEYCDSSLINSSGGVKVDSSSQDVKSLKKMDYDFVDELDSLSLRVRQRMLLSRMLLGTVMPATQANPEHLSNQDMENDNRSESSVVGVPCHRNSDEFPFNLCQTSMAVSSHATECRSSCITNECSPSVVLSQGTDQRKSTNCTGVKESFKMSSEKNYPCGVHDVVLALACTPLDSAVSTFAKVKTEPFDYNGFHNPDRIESNKSGNCLGFSHKRSLGNIISEKSYEMQHALSSSLQVKDEPLDSNYIYNFEKKHVGHSFLDSSSLKSVIQSHDEYVEDLVDHLTLKERFKLLVSRDVSKTNTFIDFQDITKTLPSFNQCEPVFSEAAKPIGNKRRKTKKKTTMDSVETALEKDAPGLLQALVDRGVSIDEIKFYGDLENDNDDLIKEESFSELEAVISKLYSRHHSLLKLAPQSGTKCGKLSYCLACLVSLIEQTRYLLFRKWPVEWGWCRDLRSFIFVFKRHHRIVLERPEYGFATYSFELANSLSIRWQIKRLIIVMKLCSCSRTSLMENKPLLVGEDLSEWEARVLIEYGWTRNSGLGSMLNYCDRVVHDRRNEEKGEWKSKIRKLLMDGFNGGTLVPQNLAPSQNEDQIKLEEDL